MTTPTTTKAPWCPRCGGELVREGRTLVAPWRHPEPLAIWTAGCLACGFPYDRQPYTHKDEGEVIDYARRLVRAELARQALEMRAHGSYTRASRYDGAPFADWPTMESVMVTVSAGYAWIGKNPLRLPREGVS